ncbi:unnamed protein product [Parnassius apollo]|uniref:(apollo) hypothetical protein n=1 Tax=Parnassius apollo TaxID=110799 RepID=A0A8S3WNX1_PARAO|nr:unnamed protein product [Parnassius apollo]
MDTDRISHLLEDVSTPETSDIADPYHDHEGKHGSDEDYCPSAHNDSNAPVSPSLLTQEDITAVNTALQYPEVEQPVAQTASDNLLPNDMDIFLQSSELEEPSAQTASDNLLPNDMDVFVQSSEVEQPGAQTASDNLLPNDMDVFLQSSEGGTAWCTNS